MFCNRSWTGVGLFTNAQGQELMPHERTQWKQYRHIKWKYNQTIMFLFSFSSFETKRKLNAAQFQVSVYVFFVLLSQKNNANIYITVTISWKRKLKECSVQQLRMISFVAYSIAHALQHALNHSWPTHETKINTFREYPDISKNNLKNQSFDLTKEFLHFLVKLAF